MKLKDFFRMLIAICLLPLAMAAAGCQATGGDLATKIEAGLRANLPQACKVTKAAYATFQQFVQAEVVSTKVVNKVEVTYAGVVPLCDGDTGNVTLADAVGRVISAGLAINQAIRDNKNKVEMASSG